MKVDYKIKEMCHAGGFTLVRVSQIKRITEIGFHQKIKRGKFTLEQLNELASIVGCEVECCYVFPKEVRLCEQIQQDGKTTDAVDELIIKVGHAPQKKFKVIEKDKNRETR